MFKYLIFLLIISCVPQGGNITPGPASQGAFAPSPDITHLTIAGSQLILDGSNFEGVTFVTLKDPSDGSVKPFDVISANFSQLISEAIDSASIPMNKGLELILSNAYGQSTFPVTFSLQPNSIDRTHIKNAEVTLNKLDPGTDRTPGKVIKWDGTKFFMGTDTGGGGGGGSITLDLGSGLIGSSDPIVDSGLIAVDIGITGDPSKTKIPYFNSTNQLELAESAEILFSHPTDADYSLFNNFGALTIQKDNVTPAYFIVNKTGTVDVPIALRVAGKSVCLGDGAGCPGAFGSSVTNITVTPPLTGGGPGPTVNISPGNVNTPGNLVVLDGTGGFPASVKVVSSLTAGTSTYVSPASTGALTVGVVFGAGNAQRHQTYLDNLGTLNPNDNYVIIGNGTSFEVQGGDTLLTSLGAQKADADLAKLAGLTPYLAPNANMIVGSLGGWITQQVPNCTTGNVVIGDGSFLSCSPNTWNFSGGTLTSNNQLGMQLRAPASGTSTSELHFLGSNNSNYVGLKAATGVASNTIWTLPLADGASGYGLTTDGSGNLFWTSVGGANDVSNPATSTMGNLASFSSITGKVIQDSGIASANVVTMALPALAANRVLTSNGANKTAIDSGVTIDGSNNVSGIQNLTVKGTNTSTPATLTSAVDFMTGRNSAGVYNAGQTSADLAFEQGVAGGGFKHYISTTHNNLAASNLNSFRFYLNNSTTPAGSSQPGTGNVLAMTITPLGVGILNSTPTNALDITGNTVMTGSLTINNNGTNSSTFPTTRGTNGQVLTAAAAGAMSWATPATGTVTGTGTDSHIMKWLGTTAAQDSGIIIDSSNNVTGMGTLNTRTIANWVDGPASATATNLASFVNGKQIQDSGLLTANIPIMTSNGVAGNLIQTAAANKTLSDSAIKVADVVTKSSNFSAANRVLLALNGTTRIATETGYTIPGIVCGNTLVLKSDGTNMTCQADLNSGDVLGPASSATNAIAKFSDGSGKILTNSGIIIDGSNNVTGTNAFTSSGNMTVDSTTFFVDAANNEVGIGRATNDLYASLDVVGNIYVTKHGHASLHDAAEIGNRQIGMKSGNTGDGFTGMQLNVKALESDGTTARANNSDIAFYTWIAGISVSREVARITERGRLGIGTTNPDALLHVNGTAHIGTQGPTVAPFNAGVSRLNITGPAGSAGGPHVTFNDDGDIYPQRQFLNWAHSNIWDCFDCYYDGTSLRNSDANSAFRWTKTATDLILDSVAVPTQGGNEAHTNRFWVNENGNATFANDLQVNGKMNVNGTIVAGPAKTDVLGNGNLNKLTQESLMMSNPPVWYYGGQAGAGNNPSALPAGNNGLRQANANFAGGNGCCVYTPAIRPMGSAFYVYVESTWSTAVGPDRTDHLGVNMGVPTGWVATYVSNGTTWEYQGKTTTAEFNASRTAIVSNANPGFGNNGQVLTTNGTGGMSWQTNAALMAVGTDNHIMRWDGTDAAQDSGVIVDDSDNVSGLNDLLVKGILTINAGTANSITLPTVRGVIGQTLFLDNNGIMNWGSIDPINMVRNTGVAEIGNLASFSNLSGKEIRDSGISLLDVPTMATVSGMLYKPILSANSAKGLGAAPYTFPNVICGDGQILKSNATGNFTCADETGGVSGPTSSTDNAIARFDGTTGKLIQNSPVTIADTTGTLDWPDAVGTKMLLWGSGTNSFGLGISSGQMNFWVPSTNSFNFYSNGENNAGTKTFTLESDGDAIIVGNATIKNTIISDTPHGASWGCFSNSAVNTTTGYGVCQSTAGTTLVNAPTGQSVQQRINNTAVTTVNNTGLSVSGTLGVTGNTSVGGNLVISPDNSNITFGTWGGGAGRISTSFVWGGGDGESNMSFYTRMDPGGLLEMARIDGNSGNFLIRGSFQGGQFSDNSLKKNISDLSFESSLDFIKKLRPVEFKWNAQGGKFFPQTKNEKHYGFIAQDVERILPGMVTKNELSGYKSLEYHEVIPFLVRALQEQQKTIESLTGKPLSKDNLLGNEKIPTELFNNPESLLILRPEKESGMESETEKLKREISLLREQNQRIQKQLDAINARLNPKVSSD